MSSVKNLSCFKAYDIRGKLGVELNEEVAYLIGRAFAEYLGAKKVVVGGDIRLTSEALKMAVAQGLMDAGCDVIDIGMTGTEEVYFSAFHLDVDGGIEVTASHNPMDYNGMKFVGRGAAPISGDSGLKEIQRIAEAGEFKACSTPGELTRLSILDDYVDHLFTYIDPDAFNDLKLIVNSGNGAAGHVVDAIEAQFKAQNISVEFIKLHHEADGNFPNGIPNPILIENQKVTSDAVREHGADMGIAWDGDFDRCFLFDGSGEFIEGYYIVGLLSEAFLKKYPGEKVIHDPRMTWNTIDIAETAGGTAIQSKTGHAFIKDRMRAENAVYGGEMSAHHYFRDFAYCDSGMIPWLLISELVAKSQKPLAELVGGYIKKFPCSGEINYKVNDTQKAIARLTEHYEPQARKKDTADGISLEFDEWRFNLRASNTEPLLRLNVEAKGDEALVRKSVADIEALISEFK